MAAVKLRGGGYLSGPPRADSENYCESGLRWLAELESEADQVGLRSLGNLARQLINDVPWGDVAQRSGFDGDRAIGTGPCRNCAMNFTSEAIVSIDPRCEFLTSFGPETIFIPADFNVARCMFCGHEAGIDTPAMCYIPHRQQVIYCLPAQGTLTRDKAVDLFGPAIQSIRERYLDSLDTSEQHEFESCPELIANSREQFLYAIHMGETVYEDHVYNLITNEDGTGMIMDVTKGFFRELSVAEMQQRQRRGRPRYGIS
jgi:hypothetical protein